MRSLAIEVPPAVYQSEPSSRNPPADYATMRHSHFYMEDDHVVLRVADTSEDKDRLFRVHRYFLERDSEVFRGMFSCSPGSDVAEGQSDETAIPLPGVTVQELESLLSFLYEGMYDEPARNLDSWVALLSISSRYLFDKIRDRAIREIAGHTPQLNPVERLSLALKHDIPQWIKPACVDLCVRPESLTEGEAEELGLCTVVRLARAREEYLRQRIPSAEMATSKEYYYSAGDSVTGCGCKNCRAERRSSDNASVDVATAIRIVEETSFCL